LDSEAEAISAETRLPIKEFAKQVPDKTPYIYEMKKSADGKCFFLKNNQCCIYAHRPLICRFYPFELKFSQERGTHIFDFTTECPGIGKGKTQSKADFEELFRLAQARLG
jgi:Fe-S-cluster containining protein